VLTGTELVTRLSTLDYLFVGVSTGGTIAGLSKSVRRQFPGVRVVAVDAEGSAAFGTHQDRGGSWGWVQYCPATAVRGRDRRRRARVRTATIRGCHELVTGTACLLVVPREACTPP